MSKVIINDVELHLDTMDADVFERYETRVKELHHQISQKDYSRISTAEGMRFQCRVVEKFFDDVFGTGTANAVFGEGNNHLGDHLDAFAKTTELARNVNDGLNAIAAQYSPQRIQDRAQRPKKGKKQRYNNRPQPYYQQ